MLLAGLAEMSPTESAEPDEYHSPWLRDRAWWLTLKRRLNGNEHRFTSPVARPQKLDVPEPVIHEGALAQAGMSPDAYDRLDALLTQWAADSNEAFVACVVRHGVIVLHKAYGSRDGQSMTTRTKSYMASLSKLLAGTQIMMLVDQGLVDLDAPIDRYLPELAGAKFNRMPTLRHLYTHTAGMDSHRGEDDHDLEHIVADLAPHTPVGQRFLYNGMSLELGTKILEQVTGKPYPIFARDHLLMPLGCTDTDALNASWNTRSTALDMARLGQMLLNGGAYGQHHFMTKATHEKMLPQPLTITLGPGAKEERGIGTQWFNEPPLGPRTYAHGAASSATLRIDPDNDLVVSMTRNAGGRNFAKYHGQFLNLIAQCMLEPKAVQPARP